jgi:phosphoribosylformylglycinamidine cyclo-ligase
VPRILPPGVAARFQVGAWEVPPIFRLVQGRGSLPEREMFRVFNMGVGMVLVVSEHDVAVVQAAVREAQVIGEVVSREGEEQVLLE